MFKHFFNYFSLTMEIDDASFMLTFSANIMNFPATVNNSGYISNTEKND